MTEAVDLYAEAERIVRERDPDRFIANLFASADRRRHLSALYAFHAEIARIRHVVSEPGLGEIRLQWWRDAIANGEGGGNPLAEALLQTIAETGLPRHPFDALLNARIFDLYHDPMPTMADFEGYAGETESALFQLGALAAGGESGTLAADVSGHAGVALLLRDRLVSFGRDSGRRQLFLPREIFDRHRVDLDSVFSALPSTNLTEAIEELRSLARAHLNKAKAGAASLAPAVRAVFLPLATVEADLGRLVTDSPFQPPQLRPRWRRQLAIWRLARRWRR